MSQDELDLGLCEFVYFRCLSGFRDPLMMQKDSLVGLLVAMDSECPVVDLMVAVCAQGHEVMFGIFVEMVDLLVFVRGVLFGDVMGLLGGLLADETTIHHEIFVIGGGLRVHEGRGLTHDLHLDLAGQSEEGGSEVHRLCHAQAVDRGTGTGHQGSVVDQAIGLRIVVYLQVIDR